MSVTCEATLMVTLGSWAFQEVAWSFSPSPHTEASSGVWVWVRQDPCLYSTHTPGLQQPQDQVRPLNHPSVQSPEPL